MATMQILKLPGESVTTTFYNDFSIAEKFGVTAIRETYERSFESWKDDYRYLTNLVVTLNYKSWDWDGKDDEYAELYVDLYEKASAYASENLRGEELSYYFNITD